MEDSNIYDNFESNKVESHEFELNNMRAETDNFDSPVCHICDSQTFAEPLELRISRLEKQVADLAIRLENHKH